MEHLLTRESRFARTHDLRLMTYDHVIRHLSFVISRAQAHLHALARNQWPSCHCIDQGLPSIPCSPRSEGYKGLKPDLPTEAPSGA